MLSALTSPTRLRLSLAGASAPPPASSIRSSKSTSPTPFLQGLNPCHAASAGCGSPRTSPLSLSSKLYHVAIFSANAIPLLAPSENYTYRHQTALFDTRPMVFFSPLWRLSFIQNPGGKARIFSYLLVTRAWSCPGR